MEWRCVESRVWNFPNMSFCIVTVDEGIGVIFKGRKQQDSTDIQDQPKNFKSLSFNYLLNNYQKLNLLSFQDFEKIISSSYV